MSKYIAITMRIDVIESYQERRNSLDQKWIEFIVKCGFVPLLLPNNLIAVSEILNSIQLSGFVLSGGNNLSKYGGDAPDRDEVEVFCIKYAETNNVPLLGVCRGMQVIADYYDINLINVSNHVAIKHPIFNENQLIRTVNSYHTMGIDIINNTFKSVYQSKDGYIECIKHTNLPIMGIMWHPEREFPFLQEDIEMFRNLFNQ